MPAPRSVYWDSSVFISYLSATHRLEKARADIAEDILKHARGGEVQIWTSVWTMAEVVRPRSPVPANFPLPPWAILLEANNADGTLKYPKAPAHFMQVWEFYRRNTLPQRLVSEPDALKIRAMFEWPFIQKIDVVPVVSQRAAEICRTHNMKAGDAVHVASALYRNCEVIHRWDRDFTKTDSLIPSAEPERMSPQDVLPGLI